MSLPPEQMYKLACEHFDAGRAQETQSLCQQILSDHPRIDFALRSHSSANARMTSHCLAAPDPAIDDNSSYAQAFCAFMERVKPRYASPFASNHCHLHKDTWAFNSHVTPPSQVAKALAEYQKQRPFPTEL